MQFIFIKFITEYESINFKAGNGGLIPNFHIMATPTHEEIQQDWEETTGTTAEGTSASGEVTGVITNE